MEGTMKKIIKTLPAKWNGNGFGTESAQYMLYEDGEFRATIYQSGSRWIAQFPDRRVHRTRFADLKEALLK
jgi:hypothetical protein